MSVRNREIEIFQKHNFNVWQRKAYPMLLVIWEKSKFCIVAQNSSSKILQSTSAVGNLYGDGYLRITLPIVWASSRLLQYARLLAKNHSSQNLCVISECKVFRDGRHTKQYLCRWGSHHFLSLSSTIRAPYNKVREMLTTVMVLPALACQFTEPFNVFKTITIRIPFRYMIFKTIMFAKRSAWITLYVKNSYPSILAIDMSSFCIALINCASTILYIRCIIPYEWRSPPQRSYLYSFSSSPIW